MAKNVEHHKKQTVAYSSESLKQAGLALKGRELPAGFKL